MEAEAESKRRQADAKKKLHAPDGLSDDMMEWLGQHRLQQCAADLARIAGAYAQPPYIVSVLLFALCFIGGALLAGRWSLATCST